MATIPEALNVALAHHQAGRLQAAEQIYRDILAVNPNQPDAWHLLGLLAHAVGRNDIAVEYIENAIRLNGEQAIFHTNLGVVHRALKRLPDAVAAYQRALQLAPDYAEAHENLGTAWQEQENWTEAIACYRRALQLRPDHAETHNNLGTAWQNQGRLDEASACYQRALQLKPDHANAHKNLGTVWKNLGRPEEAIASFQRALQWRPDDAETHNNLGGAWKSLGRVDEASACYQRALQLKPDYAEAHNNLGNVWKTLRKLDEAVASYQCALQWKPDFAEAYNNLGAVWQGLGRLDEAVNCYQHSLELKPDNAGTHYNLGTIRQELGKLDEAIACYERALQLRPGFLPVISDLMHQRQLICQWQDLERLSREVIDAITRATAQAVAEPVSPFNFLALPTPTTAEQQLQAARLWVNRLLQGMAEVASVKRGNSVQIRLGYLSADFHSHATAWLIAELFEKHDRGRFSVYAYSYGPDDDSPMRRRLIEGVDRFIDLKDASFAESAKRIAADEVDILIDLKGYTRDTRTEILAFRPAPIQVNYLGYPGTMAAPFIDYILVDDFVVPLDQQPFYTEKLVHLPGCYQVNDSRREIAERTPTRQECGLPAEGFVFCCFNNNYKITPAMFEVWMRLLQAMPGSVLWLLEGNRFAPANLRREAEARGVAAERLVFAPRMSLSEHLARHRLADLFLDTLPYNAHTTASDALWTGCPVLTIAGTTFASRVAGSLLRALGLPELITSSVDEYEAMAQRLARDPARLADLRARLHANRTTSELFDAGPFARHLEAAYCTMWEIYQAGEKPRGFAARAT